MTTANGGEPKAGTPIFWLVYGQIAAMLGAFSFLVLLQNFINVGLNGVVAQAFEGWVQYIRPIVGLPVQALVDLLPDTWRFQTSPVEQDYLAVGLVLFLSYVRTVLTLRRGYFSVGWLVLTFVALLIGWPAMIVGMLYGAFFVGDTSSGALLRAGAFITIFLAPLIYLGFLFAANALLA